MSVPLTQALGIMRILASLLSLLLVACGAAPNTAGVPLGFGLTSYSSKTDVLSGFADGHRTDVTENSSLGPNDKRPPFSIYTVRVSNVSDLGVAGELRLDFFNDRLMGAWFYPDDVPAYQAAMLSRRANVTAAPGVETWTARDYRGKWYIAWEDKALREERFDWIDRYA